MSNNVTNNKSLEGARVSRCTSGSSGSSASGSSSSRKDEVNTLHWTQQPATDQQPEQV